jgi:tetratricopeptide (TPR) repeat protein
LIAALAYSSPMNVDVEIDNGEVGVLMKPRRVATRVIVAGALVLGMLSSNVFAGGAVTVNGSVTDINGNPLRGVEVSAVAEGSDESISALTKKNGQFSIKLADFELMYELTFTKEDFEAVSTEFIPGPEKLSPLDVTLALAIQTEQRDLAIPVFNEGVAALETGDKAAALEKFRQASEIDPDFADAARATAAVAMELEDFATAADAGENLVRLQPDNLDAISTAYFAELMLGDVERLIPAARRLADANPEVVSNEMVQHATVLFDNNEFAGSRSMLEIVIEKAPETAAAYLQLGLVCNMAGDPVCAKDALKSYLELAPDGPDAATARSLLEYLK